MSNKKRIQRRVWKLQQKKLSKFIIPLKNIDKASGHASDSLRMLLFYTDKFGTTVKEFLAECSNTAWEPLERKVTYSVEYASGYSFTVDKENTIEFLKNAQILSPAWSTKHVIIAKSIPENWREDILGLMKVGFTLFEAFEELKNVYNF